MIKPIPEHNSMMSRVVDLLEHMIGSNEQIVVAEELAQLISSFGKMAEILKRKYCTTLS